MPTFTPYRDVRHLIRSGDLGLLRTPEGLIALQTRSDFSHAMTCVWRNGDQRTLAIAESREGRGGQVLTLRSQVRRFPGRIDIYTPTNACPEILRERAATIAFNWAGYGYAYPNIFWMAVVHRPELRWLAEQFGHEFKLGDTTPSDWAETKVCSQLHGWAYRKAAIELAQEGRIIWKQCPVDLIMRRSFLDPIRVDWDPVPNLGDRWIEPGDLARSGSYTLAFEGLTL
jgi:hypothetical protein